MGEYNKNMSYESTERDFKVNRILTIYSMLTNKEFVKKEELSKKFKVTPKTIQRDIDDIRNYFFENSDRYGEVNIEYNRKKNTYGIDKKNGLLMEREVLAVIKVLLESRAFCKEELANVTEVLLGQVEGDKGLKIKKIIGNELLNYISLKNSKPLLDKLWDISTFIRRKDELEILYLKINGKQVIRIIKPVGIIFSEFYFYLIAYIGDSITPIVYRLDRIESYKTTGNKYLIKEINRFNDGEFRKRIQFMYSGDLERVVFEFSGISIEPVLDKLPTAKIIDKKDNIYLIEAEVYGKGILMWLLSQGSKVKVLKPKSLLDEIKQEVEKLNELYKINE